MNNTWARHCDKYFFVTTIHNEHVRALNSEKIIELSDPLPLVQPAGLVYEKYSKLTDKVYASFKHVYKYYNDYEWYLKADDDTFVFTDNLKLFLRTKNSSDLQSYGYIIKNNVHVIGGYQAGGSGYLFGNRAMKLLGKALEENKPAACPNSGIEDVDVRKCFIQLNVSMGNTLDLNGRNRFHSYNLNNSIRFLGDKVGLIFT